SHSDRGWSCGSEVLLWTQLAPANARGESLLFELEFQIRKDPEKFITLLQKEANLPVDLQGPWHSAHEVCFYRDFLHRFDPKSKSKYSSKRTFDFALFSDEAVIVIEAKAAEVFKADQAQYFLKDRNDLQQLLGPAVRVFLIALGSK